MFVKCLCSVCGNWTTEYWFPTLWSLHTSFCSRSYFKVTWLFQVQNWQNSVKFETENQNWPYSFSILMLQNIREFEISKIKQIIAMETIAIFYSRKWCAWILQELWYNYTKQSMTKQCMFCRIYLTLHIDVIKWKHFPRHRPFVRGIHRSRVDSPHRGQWRGALMFSLIRAWKSSWANNRDVNDLIHRRAHDDVAVMIFL